MRTGVILALQGASNRIVQAAMAGFVDRRAARGARVAGVVEVHPGLGRHPASLPLGIERGCADGIDHLRDLATGRTSPLYRDIGPGSTSCKRAGAAAWCRASG